MLFLGGKGGYFQKGSKILDMTSAGLEKMFEGDLCRKISAGVDVGMSRGSSVRRPWIEDSHRSIRNLRIISNLWSLIIVICNKKRFVCYRKF